DDWERFSVVTGHPRWLLDRWSQLPGASVADLALHSVVNPPTIVNSAHARQPLPLSLTPHSEPGHHVYTGARAALSDLLNARADLWVQDPASARAVATVAALTPRLIVDHCAGQGTKTRQL